MAKKLMLAMVALLAGCSVHQKNDRAICWKDGRGYSAKVWRDMSGDLAAYEVQDQNGLYVRIDRENSHQWRCHLIPKDQTNEG